MTTNLDRPATEERFRSVFSHLGAVAAYRGGGLPGRRRRSRGGDDDRLEKAGGRPPRRSASLALRDERRTSYSPIEGAHARFRRPSPWLRRPRFSSSTRTSSPRCGLSYVDREALLLVAWEDLTPTQAARSLGINPTAFRGRLLRARRRLRARLAQASAAGRREPSGNLDMETT